MVLRLRSIPEIDPKDLDGQANLRPPVSSPQAPCRLQAAAEGSTIAFVEGGRTITKRCDHRDHRSLFLFLSFSQHRPWLTVEALLNNWSSIASAVHPAAPCVRLPSLPRKAPAGAVRRRDTTRLGLKRGVR